MRYKLSGLLAVFLVLAASVSAHIILANSGSNRTHQHLAAQEKAPCTLAHGDGELCSNLPLLLIDTAGVEIPGAPTGEYFYDEDGVRFSVYTKAENGDSRITARLSVVDQSGLYNHPGDPAALDSRMTIRVRGRSSRNFEKKGYALTLVNEDGTNRSEPLLGMDAHHDWALHGPFLDKSEMRNYMFYNLAGEVMDWAPNVRYCEVLLNGEYQGLYVLTETITAGDVEGSRLPLKVSKQYQTYTGYAVCLDQNYEVADHLNTFTTYVLRKGRRIDLELVYPRGEKATEKVRAEITQDFSDFEKALYSFDYDEDTGWHALIDADSFADTFLINEITQNYDFGSLSTYVYKSTDNRYRMAVWDFNNACDLYWDPLPPRGFMLQDALWFDMLFRDEDFVRRVITRYRTLRRTVFSDAYLDSYVDGVAAYIAPAVERDRARWAEAYATTEQDLPPERVSPTWEAAREQLKNFLFRRLAWMDENIESLLQNSAASRNKKFSEVPY